jgi:hypothetical protein
MIADWDLPICGVLVPALIWLIDIIIIVFPKKKGKTVALLL